MSHLYHTFLYLLISSSSNKVNFHFKSGTLGKDKNQHGWNKTDKGWLWPVHILKNCQWLEAQPELWNHSWIFCSWKRPCCSCCLIFSRMLQKNYNHTFIFAWHSQFLFSFLKVKLHRDWDLRVVHHFLDNLFQLCQAFSAKKFTFHS